MKKILLEEYKDRIKFLYFEKKLALREIAKEINISPTTIRKNMLKWNMPRRESRKRVLVKLHRQKLEELYIDKKLPMHKISENFGVATATVFKWINEYKIPIRRFKYKKSNFSGNPNERAYILGWVFGDLHVRRHGKQIQTELTTTHPKMMKLFYSIFKKYSTPGKYIKYNKKTGRYEWKGWVLLDNSFGFMLSEEIDIDDEYFYDFLAGFFDCEGCLFIYNNHGYIGLSILIYNYNKKLLDIIKTRLKKDGFHPKLSIFFKKGKKTSGGYFLKGDLWAIRLHTNKEVLSLINKIPIKHKEKLCKLDIINSFNMNDKWDDISDKVRELRTNIKKEVKEYINPLNFK